MLNVIEDAAERLETLCDAFRIAKRLLVVSALIRETVNTTISGRFRDGVLTRRNTFQKFYEQRELQQYIEDALETTAVPVALGIFYVFREPGELQDFLANRTRRPIDWSQISARLGVERHPSTRVDHYAKHKEILDSFWATMLRFGRPPRAEEFPRDMEMRQTFGSPRKAERLFLARGGVELLDKARQSRRNGLLVYLALSNLRKPTPFRQLSLSLQCDMHNFFGDYQRALTCGRDLLFSAGDSEQIQKACQSTILGWQDARALYIHRSLLEKLPPVLQVYVGCAELLGGDANEVDLIKLHKTSGKVTFLIYRDFQSDLLPKLHQRIKINLRTLSVQVFDHSNSGQVLFFKDKFLLPEDPFAKQVIPISAKLRKLGVTEIKAAELVVKCLENEGTQHIFGLPGEEIMDVLEALLDSSIQFVMTRHEQGAAFMADVNSRCQYRSRAARGFDRSGRPGPDAQGIAPVPGHRLSVPACHQMEHKSATSRHHP